MSRSILTHSAQILLLDLHNAQTGNYLKLLHKFAPSSPTQIFNVRLEFLAKVFVGRYGRPHKKTADYNMEVLKKGGLIKLVKLGHKGFRFSFPHCGFATDTQKIGPDDQLDQSEPHFLIINLSDSIELSELSKLLKNDQLQNECTKLLLKNSKNKSLKAISKSRGRK